MMSEPNLNVTREHMQDQKRFGETVRRFRKAKGWSQDILAERSGIHRADMGQLSSVRRQPAARPHQRAHRLDSGADSDQFRRALATNPKVDRIRQDLGVAPVQSQKWDEAAEVFAPLTKSQPDSAPGFPTMAPCHRLTLALLT